MMTRGRVRSKKEVLLSFISIQGVVQMGLVLTLYSSTAGLHYYNLEVALYLNSHEAGKLCHPKARQKLSLPNTHI